MECLDKLVEEGTMEELLITDTVRKLIMRETTEELMVDGTINELAVTETIRWLMNWQKQRAQRRLSWKLP